MTKDEHMQYWRTTAQHDIESAESIFNSGRYDWSLYVAHLALEKLLKAYWVRDNDSNVPPKIHDLVKIVKRTKLQLEEEDLKFLGTVNDFNIEARYPDVKFDFYKLCTKEFTLENLEKIRRMYALLSKTIR